MGHCLRKVARLIFVCGHRSPLHLIFMSPIPQSVSAQTALVSSGRCPVELWHKASVCTVLDPMTLAHRLSQHFEVQLVAIVGVLPSHRLIQRDTQARLS